MPIIEHIFRPPLPAQADAKCLIRLEFTRNASLTHFKSTGATTTFLRIEGQANDQINLDNNELSSTKTLFDLGPGVLPAAVTFH
ncbi:MAG: hypothetical protein JWR19_1545 [Pedosphaera sp.]|nr:hypothetical protein [Pedosphaera sp.]